MSVTVNSWQESVPGMRVDGEPWRIRFHEYRGRRPGPATAIVAGIIGDKPLAVLAVHQLGRRLAEADLAGTVVLVPAANPFGLSGGTRHNPDLIELNRRFPGRPSGFMTDQLAHTLISALLNRVDCVVDLHSGTPSRALNYTYDYGNLELSASFGYLPVVVDRHVPGQLSQAVVAQGGSSFLAEFGGAEANDPEPGIEGCLNTLRYRGHLNEPRTGPDKVAVLDRVKVFLSSHSGALDGRHGAADLGKPVPPGDIGWITNVVTGERLESYRVEGPGETAGTGPGFDLWGPSLEREFEVRDAPLLMLAPSRPAMVAPGEFTYGVGWVRGWIDAPG